MRDPDSYDLRVGHGLVECVGKKWEIVEGRGNIVEDLREMAGIVWLSYAGKRLAGAFGL
jgi:hypothetical protein